MSQPLQGLYAITDPQLTPGDRVLSAAEAALRGGATLLQYRDKPADADTRRHRAARLALLCKDYGARFIVNDDAALAAEVEADGVHLGQSDGAVGRARMLLGDDKLIGVSCHGRLDLAQKAADEGADYLALGRFFESRTKPGAPPASLDTLREARRRFSLPLVAIGGVNPHNARQLIEAGADLNRAGADNGMALTAVHLAAIAGHTAMLSRLAEAGADLDVQGVSGATPLYWAAFEGQRDAVLALLDAGADPDVRSETAPGFAEIAEMLDWPDVAARLAERAAE